MTNTKQLREEIYDILLEVYQSGRSSVSEGIVTNLGVVLSTDEIMTLLQAHESEVRREEQDATAMEIIHQLDELEMKQPEDLKTDNWRNWKYIRNSIVDKYDILQKLRNQAISEDNDKKEV